MSYRFYEDYFKFIGATEAPRLYHRWTAASIIGALLGRQIHFPFGHSKVYPNMYVMLVGNPGTRKGTAMRPGKSLLKAIKFVKFGPDRISPEKFISELMHINMVEYDDDTGLENLTIGGPSEMYVHCGEFGDFIGQGNLSFVNLLTNLWDNLDEYKHPKLHGKSVNVDQPTISILTASTQQGIALSIPIEAIGQGFLSRFILVQSEPTGIKIPFPDPVDQNAMDRMTSTLKWIQENCKGQVTIDASARGALDEIYRTFEDLEDFRFKHYSTRRFDHLLKLCIIFACMDKRTTVTQENVITANTLLHYTELKMPKALGEFGKSKFADVTNMVLELLRSAKSPLPFKTIYKAVSQDLSKQADLIEIIKNLRAAGKVQALDFKGSQCFSPVYEPKKSWKAHLIDEDYLQEVEKGS